MLVQRQTNRRRTLILTIVLILVAIAGVVFASRRFLSKPPTNTQAASTSATSNISLSTIRSLDTSILRDPRLLELRARSGFSTSPQAGVRVEDPAAPQPPENVAVTDPAIGGTLSVTWTLPADARITGVRIYRSDVAGLAGEKIADLGAAASGYEDGGLTNGKTYYYLVRTTMTSGVESTNVVQQPGQPMDAIPPAPPTDVRTQSVDAGRAVLVSWTNPTDRDFSHLKLYRSTSIGEVGSIRFDLVSGTEIRDESVQPGVLYYYTVVSVDRAGNESGINLLTTPGKPNPFEPTF